MKLFITLAFVLILVLPGLWEHSSDTSLAPHPPRAIRKASNTLCKWLTRLTPSITHHAFLNLFYSLYYYTTVPRKQPALKPTQSSGHPQESRYPSQQPQMRH
ncbi:hypothetical protein BJ878DRAFT_484152 [Calycina marina]|uniref:Secreted protein n=1 Tax=Calycina marina TaxID=1763456 RepID=A0A9P7YUL3_9HELO|nr:hypothetical protein BJ878DRAFT_484152 [Calycina marina]